MNFTFTIDVSVERDQGKFASKDEILEQLQEALDSANPDTISNVGADGNSEYSITEWSVNAT